MKNVIMLAPYFLPRRRVSVWRPFKFAIHLKEFGYNPHIITIHAEGSFTDKEKRLLEDTPIYSINSPFDFTDKSESSRSYSGKTESKKRNTSKELSPLLKGIDSSFPVDTWLPLFLIRERYIKKVISGIDPDLIWSTGDPWSGHLTAYRMTKKYNLPWVADFRDPWTLGEMNLKKRTKFSSAVDKYYEKKVVSNASVLTFTAKRTERLYRQHYREYSLETSTIYNSFDISLYENNIVKKNIFDPAYLNLIFFGSFRTRSPASIFIDVLQKLHECDRDAAAKIRMYSFGSLNRSDKKSAFQSGFDHQILQLNPIPPEQALSYLNQADLLWLSTTQQLKNIIPAKLWDYLAADRPVISIASNPEVGKILDKTGTGIHFKAGDYNSIAKFFKKCVSLKTNKQDISSLSFYNPNKKIISSFGSRQSTRRLAQLFDTLV